MITQLKINYRFIFRTIGFLLFIESLCLFLSALLAVYWDEDTSSKAIFFSTAITFLSGVLFNLFGDGHHLNSHITKREGVIIVTLSWVLMSFFGMLPFLISQEISNITDAYFETMSGFSATGSTIFSDVERIPKSLLFWRSLTQWIGGIGIIVFALVLLPMIGGNASVLYDAETTGMVREKLRPRIGQVAKRLFLCYISLTCILAILLALGPMTVFDAVCHAMTTLSTGGFSTRNDSIAYWDSAYVEYVITLFMFLGGMNFTLIYFMFRGAFIKARRDEEFRWYVAICTVFTLVITVCILSHGLYDSLEKAFRISLFQVISTITTTAFTVTNYLSWGTFYIFVFNLLMIFCACAGSTTGGMKIARLIVLVKNTVNEFKLQVHPNAVLPVRINNMVVSNGVVSKVLSFMFLYLCIIFFSFIMLAIGGMTFEESIGVSISSISNVGMGYGKFGENGNFLEASIFSKWYMCLLMLIGRLEIFTVLSLFMPAFWKK